MQWFQIRKEYVKAVYCHFAYLSYMQSTSCEILEWMDHKLESRFQGEISITSDMQMTSPLWEESKEKLKILLMKVKEENEKLASNSTFKKMNIMASSHITSWQIDGETVETVRLYIWGLQNHCTW